ncbi:uncharacterized protein LOC111391615 [Olea europaea var. sylvestris]|uniref:uncharacterized protein LOC111391615 n=1 Tax=Olea europaea var. sylvestris TaxID=158386 RepID=UPI000C1D14C7|nr:uncharacterized protein LOC111391615 [Olea europaea var. sylvestris]
MPIHTNTIVLNTSKSNQSNFLKMSSNSQPSFPIHLSFLLLVLFMFIGFTESLFEGLFDQIKLFLMLSPLLVLLVLHLLSSLQGSFSFTPFPEQYAIHQAGGTPWGVGFLLVLLLFMISYQSDFRERWFSLLG